MSKKNKIKEHFETLDKKEKLVEEVTPFQHPGHTLTSRRDLFAQGMMGMGAYIATPSLLSLAMQKVAYGSECRDGSKA